MGQPKALLRWGSETFLGRIVRILNSHCDRVIVVSGAHHEEMREAHPELAPYFVYNPDHAEGQFSSLRCGLRELADCSEILLWPVDFGAVGEATVQALLAAPEAPVVKLRYEGRSGHPVLLRREAIEALREAGASSNAKAVLEQFPALRIPVTDPACVSDADTPEDYARLLLLKAQGETAAR
jgi:molybdenum cofactor cytidylyltransferase